MAQTRFQLTTEGLQLIQTGQVRFRVGFTGTYGNQTRYFRQKVCPVISVGASDVIGTTDDWAAQNLALMTVNVKTRRGGATRDPGTVFTDVTGSTVPGDVTVNLDTTFDTVR